MLLYCSAYYVVSNRFFKKRMWTFFSVFSFLSTLCVCSLHQIWLPAPSLHWITMHFLKVKKKVNKWTIGSVCHFSQAFIWMTGVWQESIFVVILHTVHRVDLHADRVQLLMLTRRNFLTPAVFHLLFLTFHIGWIRMFSGSKEKTWNNL